MKKFLHWQKFNLAVLALLTFVSYSAMGQTTYRNFTEGACIIDMGMSPQTENNAIAPYGLVYDLITNHNIPVYWVIDPNKSFVSTTNKTDQSDITITGTTTRTGNTAITKSLTAGPFLIPAEYVQDAYSVIEEWQSDRSGLTVYWNLDAIINAPIEGVITTFPQAVVYPKNNDTGATTDIEKGFYIPAGISGMVTRALPTDVKSCNQIYILSHHTDPEKNWDSDDIDALYDFVIDGGDVWMGCRDVSVTENILRTSNGTRLNFLSENGLLPYKTLENVSSNFPWLNSYASGNEILKHDKEFDDDDIEYTIATANSPIMQFLGEIQPALNGNAEHVFLPFNDGWRSTTSVGFYDPTHPDLFGGRSNGKAAIMAYGHAYGNSNYGEILYQASHINKKNDGNTAEYVGERRLFGNFLLKSTLLSLPEISIADLSDSSCGDIALKVDAKVTNAPFGNITYDWTSEKISGSGSSISFSSTNTAITTITYPDVDAATVYTITLTITDTDPDGCLNHVITSKTTTVTVTPCCASIDITCPVSFTDTVECEENLPDPATSISELEDLGVVFNEYCGDIVVSNTDVITNQTCANSYTLTRTYTILDDLDNSGDQNGNEEVISCIQVITVTDTTAPEFNVESEPEAGANIYVTVQDGDWSSASTWYNGNVPDEFLGGDQVYIKHFVNWNLGVDLYIENGVLNIDYGILNFSDHNIKLENTAGIVNIDNGLIYLIDDSFVNIQATVNFSNGAIQLCNGNYKNENNSSTNGTGYIYSQNGNISSTNNNFSAGIAWATGNGDGINLPTAENTAKAEPTDGCQDLDFYKKYIPEPPVDFPIDITVDCDNIPDAAILTATDNCDTNITVDFEEERIDGSCESSYTLTRTWTASDDCGNSVSYTQTVTVTDTTAPEFDQESLPADLTVECDSIPDAVILTATDNCDADIKVDLKEDRTDGACDTSYTLTRTWIAADDCKNLITHTQVITVIDTTAPEFDQESLPGDFTIECDSVSDAVTLTATDNCDNDIKVDLKEDRTDGSCDYSYTLTRTWMASDDCGNTITHTQIITVTDTTAPEFDQASLPVDATVECDSITDAVTLTATDNCDNDIKVDLKEDRTDGSCDSSYTLTRTWIASDDCGNTTTHTQIITVTDTTAPEFDQESLPVDLTIECDSVTDAIILTATDNCDNDIKVDLKEDRTDGSCDSNYILTRTWIASDDCGNTTIHTQIITVTDTTAPVFDQESLPGDLALDCDELVAVAATLTATDNCDPEIVVVFNEVRIDGDCAYNYTLTRTWMATDACGNAIIHTQTVSVSDTTAPEFDQESLPGDLTVECDELVATAATLTATDNCDPEIVVVFNEVRTDGSCAYNYTLNRTWTATDACGNTIIHTQTVNVSDTTAPEFDQESLPEDLTVECDELVAIAATLTATDNCDPEIVVVFNEVRTNGDCAYNYTLNRTWTATDDCGNTITHTQTVTVSDTTAPEFDQESLPGDLTLECNELVTVAATLTATDNCDPEIVVVFNEERTDGDCAYNYTLTRTWTATDDCENTITHTQTIIVSDTTAPEFDQESLPGDLTIECDALISIATTLTATDNCDPEIVVVFNEERTDGSCTYNYTLTRTWTATDACGNATIHTQTVTVSDTTAPTFDQENLPEDLTVECDGINVPETLTATDNCDTDIVVVFNEVRTDGSCDYNYTLTRTWTASDACENTVIHTQIITVTDTTAPEFVEGLPEDMTVECENVIDAATLTITDNCDPNIVLNFNEVRTDGSCANSYTLTRTWTATDACDNTLTHTQTIIVTDTTAPVFNEENLPIDIAVECDAVTAPETLTATDNCDPEITVDFSEVRSDGTCAYSYTLTRTWTATDTCGNATAHTQIVTVTDTTAPEFDQESLPADLTIECGAITTPETLTATDNCDPEIVVEFSEVRTDGACASDYILVRTWTATDACENTNSHIQIITVSDTTAPEFVEENLPADITLECDGVSDPVTLTATDNCDTEGIVVVFDEVRTEGTCASDYTLTRTWTATDACDNSVTHTQTITVTDTIAPTINTEYESEISVTCSEIPEVPELEFEDACSAEVDVVFEESSTNSSDQNYVITRTWTVTDACDNASVFTQTISVSNDAGITGTATDLCIGDDLNYDLFNLLSGDYDPNGTWEITSGNASLDGSFFNPLNLELGTYTFSYSDVESQCPSETEVTITLNDLCVVLSCDDPIISKAVTVNGDQWNEHFTIEGIEGCDFIIELQIFNRWGALIYESKDYQNNWNGEAHKNSVGASDKVPTGTYYYIINLKNSGLKPFAGPMYVTTQ